MRGFLRVFVILFALFVSDFIPAASQLFGASEAQEDECGDCDGECPPDCQDCRCAHPTAWIVAEAAYELVAFAALVEFAPRTERVRLALCGAVPYRPPRAQA